MKRTLNKSHHWVTQSVLLSKLNFKVTLLLGSAYIFAYLLVPSIPGLSFISPFLIIAWPISTMIFINFFRLSQDKKEINFKALLKINKENMRLLIYLGVICLFYSLLISLVLSPDIKNILAAASEPEISEDISNNLVSILVKFMVLAIPILMATWFSPILIAYHNFGLIKAIKSSFAGVLLSIMPITLSWLILLGGFISVIFLMIMVFTILGSSENVLMSYVLIFLCMLVLAAYISTLFSFQYITYKDVYKSITK
ncbi:BPSS1780 family membrane protein [Methylophilaceae bacterium]|nr:BPSS1780 family membrane protein [Methylophilaceae bacterium]